MFVHGPDPTDLAQDLTGDGDLDDTVLGVLDTTQVSPAPLSLCPADQVSVAAGAAAFLRPESAGATPSIASCPPGNSQCIASCPAGNPVSGGVDLDGNSTATDEVVHIAVGASIQNLLAAATAVSLSGVCAGGSKINHPCADSSACPGSTCTPSFVAALITEAGPSIDFDGDGDIADTVVGVYPASGGAWSIFGQAADTVQVEGNLVAFITPEAMQGDTDLNRDHDALDRVLQIYDASTYSLVNVGEQAEELVMGKETATCGSGPAIAFRTSEAAQGNKDLNGDGDATDEVLQVYVPGVGLTNTHEAVTPCSIAACDPRQPYAVQGDTVKFLTYEGDQKQDLNGNGTTTDLILQIFDVCSGARTVVGAVDIANTGVDPLTNGGTATQVKTAFATTAGVCVSGPTTLLAPAMCTTDADCPSGATCQLGNPIVAAPAAIPTTFDSVVLPPKPVNVLIEEGQTSVTKSLTIKVRNADVKPAREKPGHLIQLTVRDGTCPAGTVAGRPDFDRQTAGAQDTVLIKGGATKHTKIPLVFDASSYPTSNSVAPFRCSLAVSVAAAGDTENIDPTSANNAVPVEVNVINQNSMQTSTAGDVVVMSAKPVKLPIGRHSATMQKVRTIGIKLLNADAAPETVTVMGDDGTCPAGTLMVEPPGSATLAGGRSGTVKVQLVASNAAFLTANNKAPARCTATLTVSGSGSDPDLSNNTTQVVIDVDDREDY